MPKSLEQLIQERQPVKVKSEFHGNRKHGLRHSRIYAIWCNMKYRCDVGGNRASSYKDRGITYDKKWKKFENFLKDMENGYTDNLSIDRINNDGNYCKENCRWATHTQQNYNKRNTILIKGKSLMEWSKITGLKFSTIYARLYKSNWSIEKTLRCKLYQNL